MEIKQMRHANRLQFFLTLLVLMLLLPFAGPASAAPPYDVTVTMASTSGSFDSCRLYMDGAPIGDLSCDAPVVVPGLITADGTYDFAYTIVLNDDGSGAEYETAMSPTTTVSITGIVLPGDPGAAPTIQVDCAPCVLSISP